MLKRVLVVLIVAIVALPVGLWLSAQMGLDRTFRHTRATEALPVFSAKPYGGVVRIPANGFEFRARVAGFEGDGPGLILLHGFPSLSVKWAPLIERAAADGYRVVAYDQRGFSPGARPKDVAAYHVNRVAEDLFAIADAVGFEEFHLVGHDWGAMVGWVAAGSRPDRISTLTALSIPHPYAIRPPEVARTVPAYVQLFKATGFGETLLGFGNRWVLNRLFWPPMPEAHRLEYNAAYSEPGALTGALSLYRAMDPANPPARVTIKQPVLHLYGREDMKLFVGDEVQARLPQWVEGELTVKSFDTGHWLIEEREAEIVEEIMTFLQRENWRLE